MRAGATPKVLRGPRMERRSHGLLRPAGISAAPQDERVDDAIGLLLPGTALGGWASLRHQGIAWFDGWSTKGLRRALVHCEPGAQLRRRDVVEPFRGLVHPFELTSHEGVRTSTIERAAFDEARVAPDLRTAVQALDMAASRVQEGPRTTLSAVGGIIAAHWKVRGIVRAREALALASERSASPLETRTRLIARLDADMDEVLENVPIFDGHGTLLGVVDLIDPETGLVVETDGAGHREAEQHAHDNRREELLEHAGCVVVRVSPIDLSDRWAVAERLHRAARAARRPRPRSWTLDPPPWWEGSSLAERWR